MLTRRAAMRLTIGTAAGATAMALGATPAGAKPRGLALTAPLTPLGVGAGHAAFPGLAFAGLGLSLVWRQGTDHAVHRDGSIMRATSFDLGRTYGGVTTLLSGQDFRDPSLSVVGDREYLTWFTGTNANPAQGAFVRRDGASPVRIDALPYAAITAPVVHLPDGRLGAAFYGRRPGETIDTAWMAWSTDNGGTWTTNRIFNGISAGLAHNEPWLTVDAAGTTHMFARWGGWDSLGQRSSPDSGRTWGPVRRIQSPATGRPTTIATASGLLVMVYRAIPWLHARVVYSKDNGTTWQFGPIALGAPAGSPHGMTYAAMTEVLPGRIHLVVGMERADGSSALHGGYLTET